MLPVLAVVSPDELAPEIEKSFVSNGFMADLFAGATVIDMDPWIYGDRKISPQASFPHRAITHMIVSDDPVLLQHRLTSMAASIQVVVNGGEKSIEQFCKNVKGNNPVIILEHTGGVADLAVRPNYSKKK